MRRALGRWLALASLIAIGLLWVDRNVWAPMRDAQERVDELRWAVQETVRRRMMHITTWVSGGITHTVQTPFRGPGNENESEDEWDARHDARVARRLLKYPKDG